jgi:hypothetical protein
MALSRTMGMAQKDIDTFLTEIGHRRCGQQFHRDELSGRQYHDLSEICPRLRVCVGGVIPADET